MATKTTKKATKKTYEETFYERFGREVEILRAAVADGRAWISTFNGPMLVVGFNPLNAEVWTNRGGLKGSGLSRQTWAVCWDNIKIAPKPIRTGEGFAARFDWQEAASTNARA